jgi:5-methylcytosine-specific restriction endonuclease McrA
MSVKSSSSEGGNLDRSAVEAQRSRDPREKSYREQALKLFPWICARCGREFSGKRLKELTVHHKDHNHGNNPPDGSNWELLCLYCHDNEHSRYQDAEWYEDEVPGGEVQKPTTTHQPFAALADLLKNKK